MRVAIVENTAITHHGQVGVALHERAALIDQYRPFADGRLPPPGSFDALVVFGGEQSALDDQTHPYLPELAKLMADTARGDQAVLGICLGAQIMARGLGAQNLLGRTPEFGWVQVDNLAGDDPVLGRVPARFPIFQWHSDTFTLPPGAAHLAASAGAEQQCYRVGRAGYGMQFHFEASRAMARDWAGRFAHLIEPMAPGWIADLPRHEAGDGLAADGHGLALARAWVDLI